MMSSLQFQTKSFEHVGHTFSPVLALAFPIRGRWENLFQVDELSKVRFHVDLFTLSFRAQTGVEVPVSASDKHKVLIFLNPFIKLCKHFLQWQTFIDCLLCYSSEFSTESSQLRIVGWFHIVVEGVFKKLVLRELDDSHRELDDLSAGIHFDILFAGRLEVEDEKILVQELFLHQHKDVESIIVYLFCVNLNLYSCKQNTTTFHLVSTYNSLLMNQRVLVIDNGTGYTKMGYAGNLQPAFDIPTLIAQVPNIKQVHTSNRKTNEALDFEIGDEAALLYQSHRVVNPIQGGIVRDWDMMEKFWHRSLHDYLRCDPEETVVMLTQPPLNPPQNRQAMAEIMFQTFNVAGLHIAVQAVLALVSSSDVDVGHGLTGTVIDSGDGVTHVIPVADGYVIGSCIKHVPIAGSNITSFIGDMVKERGEKFPIQQLSKIAKTIKEKYGYVVEDGNLVRQFGQFDKRKKEPKLEKKFQRFVEGVDPKTKQPYKVSVGYERFLGPQVFFHPEIVDAKYRQSLDQLVDKAIQLSPIDYRRKLYDNIVMSGGSTLFDGLVPRLERNLQHRVDTRLSRYAQNETKPKPIKVNVQQNYYKRYSVWQGGSILASSPNFDRMYHSRQEYFEKGSSISRHNVVAMKI